MGIGERMSALYATVEQALTSARLAVPLAALSVVLAFALAWRSRARDATASMAPATPTSASPGASDAGTSLREPIEEDGDPAIEAFALIRPGVVAIMVLALSAAIWLFGLVLAPDRGRFAGSREWHIQPLYLGAHIVALSLIVTVLTRNFEAGVARMRMDPESTIAATRLILGPAGIIAALAIAAPLCFLDYQYLFSADYQRLGRDGTVGPVDLLMWGIWCVEWCINAYLWVMLAAFTALVCWIIARHRFRAPIEVVLQEKQYRPFLQMSAQASTVLLAFSFMTLGYIFYAGGELSDYVGLGTSVLLLIVAFAVPWLQLRAKVRALVVEETRALRRDLFRRVQERAGAASTVEQRLDEMLAILRISHTEHLHVNLGWTEAKLLMLRLLAPAITIAWQLVNGSEVSRKAAMLLKELGSRFGGWF